jgi:hypothetical protein
MYTDSNNVLSLHQQPWPPIVDDLQLPPTFSLILILICNILFNISFYIIVPSAAEYSSRLGATPLFAGLSIGIVTLVSLICLIPMSTYFKYLYRPPLHIACASLIVGHILYALADVANCVYLILLGRLVNGLGFTGWLFTKKYCTDPHFVGMRRRTTLSACLIVSQCIGMVAGILSIHHTVFNNILTRSFNWWTMGLT